MPPLLLNKHIGTKPNNTDWLPISNKKISKLVQSSQRTALATSFETVILKIPTNSHLSLPKPRNIVDEHGQVVTGQERLREPLGITVQGLAVSTSTGALKASWPPFLGKCLSEQQGAC